MLIRGTCVRLLLTFPFVLRSAPPVLPICQTGNGQYRIPCRYRAELLKIVAKQFGQTIVFITYDNDIAQMADRIVRIEDGKIVRGNDLYA